MIEVIVLSVLAILWMTFASIQDVKEREVANWLSFSLIIFALGFRFFYSLFVEGNFTFFYQGVIGFAIFIVVGHMFYYSKLFAGGDAKLMIALGAVIPFSRSFFTNLYSMGGFIFLFLLVGTIYGLAWSFFYCLKDFKHFKKEFSRRFMEKRRVFILILGLTILAHFFIVGGLFIGTIFLIILVLYIYSKSIDEVSMVRLIKSEHLREGDWLYKDVQIGKKTIRAKWGGLEKKDIASIKKKHKKVWIRYGIPFVPVFLMSFIIYLFLLRNFGY